MNMKSGLVIKETRLKAFKTKQKYNFQRDQKQQQFGQKVNELPNKKMEKSGSGKEKQSMNIDQEEESEIFCTSIKTILIIFHLFLDWNIERCAREYTQKVRKITDFKADGVEDKLKQYFYETI